MTDAPPPAGPTETPAAAPDPAAAPAMAPPVAAAPFPPVLRTPWVNPAKRNQLLLLSVLTVLAVAVIAFVIGLAVGDHGGRRGDRVGPAGDFGYACNFHDGGGRHAKCDLMMPGRPFGPRQGQFPPNVPNAPSPSQPASPSSVPSSASSSK